MLKPPLSLGILGLNGERLFSNLFVNQAGNPQTFDLSEYNSAETIVSCDNLQKLK